MNVAAGQLDLTSLQPGIEYTVICTDDRIRIEGDSSAGAVEMGCKTHGGLTRVDNGWLDLFTLTPGTTYGLTGGENWQIRILEEGDRRATGKPSLLRRIGRLRWIKLP
ncbi:hypothetical protein [Streptomyces sp. 5-10]|uniref:hypothetical protein n=1 Tax=Streptomyces sp. 5-10 TaxID=878925 RepID=UPI00168BFCE2|nr:hypothetical protein [Streptomyces sp. 5-10]MBD3004770.1 hypothetical protein [Streptomyces sp. 5-10]